ncbi:internal virion protein [Synechococcus phage S-CBP1]|uniref:Internal core protein n=1 Tax=Synechococcus phage S-CBP1 TaxID=1273711 RepID=A0A096VKF8_9CAUD|nr:internal virion protein [Synechococcus phage S-CBP1]AGK86541.1 internal core protein [Synechococcus phage S-CBP1]
MTQTPFIDEEELKRLEAENKAQEEALDAAAPSYNPTTAPQTQFQEATPEQNQAAGNVQPVKSPQDQAMAQIGRAIVTPAAMMTGQDPANFDAGKAVRQTLEGAATVPLGLIDFGVDAIGRIPGAERIDDGWDQKTKFQNPFFQKLRNVASIVVPSIIAGAVAGPAGTAAANAVKGGAIARGAATLGIGTALEAGVFAVSDQGADDNLSTMVKEAAPWLPVPESLVITDGDSTEVRRLKNIYENAGLGVVGSIVGYAFQAGKPIMSWFKANDPLAKAYKAAEALINGDADTFTRVSELTTKADEARAAAQQLAEITVADPANALQYSVDLDAATRTAKALDDESVALTKEYLDTGASRVTQNPVESYLERDQISRDLQIDEIGKERLFADPDGVNGVDPYISPYLFPEGSTAAFSRSPGYVARNMADTTAIKFGGSTGSPAPMLSERAYQSLSRTIDNPAGSTSSRDLIVDIAEEARSAGNFDAIVDGFRYTKSQMHDAAWSIYKDIVMADSVDDVRKLFLDNRDVKTILDGRKIRYINDIQAEATAYALRDLTDRYLGRVVNETSARAMDTAGREIADIAEAYKTFPESADLSRTTEALADRIGFLMEEFSLNKYIAGWALKNQDRWEKLVSKSGDPQAAIEGIKKQFDLKLNEAKLKSQNYREMIVTVAKERPDAAQALIDAFALSKGDVDTLDKLMKWGAKQVSPMGLLVGGSDGLNAFAQGAWAVRYNNILSGISLLRAGVANQVALGLRTTNAFLGTMTGMMMGKNTVDDLRKATYVYGSMWSTHNKAIGDAFDTYKRLWNAGKWGNDGKMDARLLAREDLVDYVKPDVWQTLDKMEDIWEKDGNWGKLMQYRSARFMYDLGNWRWLKYGTNGLVAADSYVSTVAATQMAKARAWDEVFSIGYKGAELQSQLLNAEKLAYSEMFDAAGNLTDDAVKYASGEIAMNLDDQVASWLSMGVNKVPVLKPFFMFPKTGVNAAKMAASYTPLALLPNTNRYAKVLWAGDNLDKVKEALLDHGIVYDAVPNGMAIFKGLEAEYRGRLAFSGLLVSGLFGHAMAGKIRGNGPLNDSERKKLRDNFGWNPKTINIGGKWVSYAGLPAFDPVLTLIADAAYYSRDIGSTLMEDIRDKVMWTFASTFVNQTFVSGLEPLVAAINGDDSAVARYIANEARAAVPMSGLLGVASNAITNSQKDIYNDMIGYVKNRLPGFSSTLPEQIDIYTGKPLNDIDNPVLRALNAVSPVKVSDGAEPWRQWLIDTGWDGLQMIRKDSSGNHEYTPAEREILYRYIGEQQIWKQFDKLRTNKKYNDQLDRIRAMRAKGRPSDEIDAAQVEAYTVLNNIVSDAQKVAEMRLQNDNPAMWNAIQESILNKNYMKQGRVDDAARAADRRKAQIEKLTQIYR